MKLANGCKAHPDCFTCPFDDCIALTHKVANRRPDVSAQALADWKRRNATKPLTESQRRRLAMITIVRKLSGAGKTYVEIASLLGIGEQTVYRYMKASDRIAADAQQQAEGYPDTSRPVRVTSLRQRWSDRTLYASM